MQNRVESVSSSRACRTISASRLLAPRTFCARTALSVEIRMKLDTPAAMAAWAVCSVPKVLFSMTWITFCCARLTCL